MTERLQEILNRKPSKWGNLTVKEFERDIKLLQERVQELEELTHKQGKVIIKQSDELDIFDQQNKRYREALIKVKLGSESDVIHYSTRLKSINKIAVEALEDES